MRNKSLIWAAADKIVTRELQYMNRNIWYETILKQRDRQILEQDHFQVVVLF